MNRFIIIILFATCTCFTPKLCFSQVEWEQHLDGWIDDVYWPYLFLGGTYYTRISFADIDNDDDLDMFYGGGDSGSLVYFEKYQTREEAKSSIFEYIEVFYNRQRRHSALVYKSPVDFENQLDYINNVSAKTGQDQESLYV